MIERSEYITTTMKRILAGLIMGLFAGMVYGQDPAVDFLKTQVQPMSFAEEGRIPSFTILDTVVPAYRFFFTAEEHWLSINTRVQYEFFDLSASKSWGEKPDFRRGL